MGSGATSRLDLEFPIGTDPAAIPTDIEGLADGLDGIVTPWTQSATAPVSPVKGTVWWNPTTTASTFGWNYFDGISWWNVLDGSNYIGSSAPAASSCYPGLIWVNTSFTCTQLQICTAGGSSPTWLILIPGSNATGEVLINTGSGIAWGSVGGPALNEVLVSPIESAYVTGASLTGLTPIYVTTNATSILYTSNATGTFSFNIAATSSVALNSLLANDEEITIAIKVSQGSSGASYYCTAIEIDGGAGSISGGVHWQGGVAPASGNANGIDAYTINITKTAANTYTVLASLVKF